MEFVSSILDSLAWPITVVILICIFRVEIIALLRRLKSADLSSKVLEFGELPLDRGEPPKPQLRQRKKVQAIQSSKVKWNKPASLFWLANNLMWIQDVLLRGGPWDKFIAGLKNVRKYARNLGLAGTFTEEELTRMIYFYEPEVGVPAPLILTQVPQLVNQIELVKRDIASRVEQDQPGFKKFRIFSSRHDA